MFYNFFVNSSHQSVPCNLPTFYSEMVDPPGLLDDSTYESLTLATQSALQADLEQKFVVKPI